MPNPFESAHAFTAQWEGGLTARTLPRTTSACASLARAKADGRALPS